MRVVTFGEILLRLSTQGIYDFFRIMFFETSFCGAEVNVVFVMLFFGFIISFII
jgi:2-dehydro-3-deoxygluconokinase